MSINIQDFSKIELVVGEILFVELVEESSKLFLLKIDIGKELPVVILSGIKKWYSIEELLNKKCIVVANLAPREMMGHTSNGMILCTSYTFEDKDIVSVIEPDSKAPNGTRVS